MKEATEVNDYSVIGKSWEKELRIPKPEFFENV